jgi:hypothetical protein
MALSLALQAPAALHSVETAIDVDLQQTGSAIGRAPWSQPTHLPSSAVKGSQRARAGGRTPAPQQLPAPPPSRESISVTRGAGTVQPHHPQTPSQSRRPRCQQHPSDPASESTAPPAPPARLWHRARRATADRARTRVGTWLASEDQPHDNLPCGWRTIHHCEQQPSGFVGHGPVHRWGVVVEVTRWRDANASDGGASGRSRRSFASECTPSELLLPWPSVVAKAPCPECRGSRCWRFAPRRRTRPRERFCLAFVDRRARTTAPRARAVAWAAWNQWREPARSAGQRAFMPKGPGHCARGATVRTSGERRMRGGSARRRGTEPLAPARAQTPRAHTGAPALVRSAPLDAPSLRGPALQLRAAEPFHRVDGTEPHLLSSRPVWRSTRAALGEGVRCCRAGT